MSPLNRKILPALILALFAYGAQGAGFQLMEQNASGLGNAYAGSAAVAENASTVFYNPAGMTTLGKGNFSAGINAVRPGFTFADGGTTGPGANVFHGSGNGGDAGSWAALPNGYGVWALNDDWYAGIGVGAPFGLKTQYNDTWFGAFQSVKFDIQTVNVNPSLAWRINDTVSLGFGVNWQQFKAQYMARTAAFGGAPLGLLATYKLDDATWGWNAGVTISPNLATRYGIAYRASMKYDLSGTLSVPNAAISLAAKARLEEPDSWIFSVVHQYDDHWELLGDLSWTGWSKIKKINLVTPLATSTLDLEFRDAWRLALGANYRLNEAWKLKLGMAYDQSPVHQAGYRPASLPDNDRTWFSIGAQYKVSPQSMIDVGYAYLYLKDPTTNNRTDPTRGNLVGTFSDYGHVAGVQYSYRF